MNIDVLNTKQKIVLAVIIFILFIIAGFYLRSIFQPTIKVSAEVSDLYKMVRTRTHVPSDEVPSLVTVNDKGSLPAGFAFANAQNGDKILVFEKNKLAVLYRPSANTVVSAVMADDLVAMAQSSSPLAYARSNANTAKVMGAETKAINIALYDDKSGELASRLRSKSIGLSFDRALASGEVALHVIVRAESRTESAKYSQPQIMDITGKNSQLVKEIAKAINANIVSFPAGKISIQNTDIMIVGK